jgi:hypothetical protein
MTNLGRNAQELLLFQGISSGISLKSDHDAADDNIDRDQLHAFLRKSVTVVSVKPTRQRQQKVYLSRIFKLAEQASASRFYEQLAARVRQARTL